MCTGHKHNFICRFKLLGGVNLTQAPLKDTCPGWFRAHSCWKVSWDSLCYLILTPWFSFWTNIYLFIFCQGCQYLQRARRRICLSNFADSCSSHGKPAAGGDADCLAVEGERMDRFIFFFLAPIILVIC